ncbi:Ionotropic receptor 151 [Frankliniella occidentalis]|nr:Ionotropic receptor 151 [Frankliniella occidentalis]
MRRAVPASPADIMDVVLALALFCTSAPGALSALPVVDVSAAPEAASAAALMSPFLRPQRACVVVLGQVRWTNAFLRGLPQETHRVVLTEQSYYEESDSLTVQVQVRHHVLVVVADGPEALTLRSTSLTRSIGRFHRALFWTTVATSAPEVVANKTFLGRVTQQRDCYAQTVLALTAADGTTTLYALEPPGCPLEGEVPAVTELDRWSPGEQRWLSGAWPFSKFCDRWLPPAPKEPLTLFVIGQWGAGSIQLKALSHDIKRYSTLNKIVTTTTVNFHDGHLREVVARIRQCRLDGFLVKLHVMTPGSDELTCSISSEGTPIAVLVPAGLGPAVNPLGAVLMEFSPAVWLGTALAALSTAAVLACTLRQDREAALLLALAPLLGQATGTPPPAGRALRPLLGVWLLVCVVLVAAYQGLLLGKLSTTRTHSEINNWRDLEDSGLAVHAMWDALNQLEYTLPENVRRRVVVRRYINAIDFIGSRIVKDRNCALIIDLHEDVTRGIQAWRTTDKSLHLFRVGTSKFRFDGVWNPGSPLGKAIALMAARVPEIGVEKHCRNLADFKERLTQKKTTATRPLTLRQMYPAVLCLVGGHIVSTVVLVLELLCSCWSLRWSHGCRLTSQ